jgi:hypothetical protein
MNAGSANICSYHTYAFAEAVLIIFLVDLKQPKVEFAKSEITTIGTCKK